MSDVQRITTRHSEMFVRRNQEKRPLTSSAERDGRKLPDESGLVSIANDFSDGSNI